jgi:hypothetical protein
MDDKDLDALARRLSLEIAIAQADGHVERVESLFRQWAEVIRMRREMPDAA